MHSKTIVSVIVLLSVILAFSGVAVGQSSPTITCDGKTSEVQISQVVELYNNNTDAVPSILQSQISSNITEVQIQGADQVYYTVSTDNSMKITDVKVGSADDPDVIVQTDKDTACALYTSNSPVSDFTQAYENDEIDIRATGFVNQAKVYVIEKVVDVMNMI